MTAPAMDRDRLAQALRSFAVEGHGPLPQDPTPPALVLAAQAEEVPGTARQDLDLYAMLARREAAEYRFRAVTRRFKRRLCGWGLCPRLAEARGLCHRHWRQGHALLRQGVLDTATGRWARKVAA